MSEHDSMHLVIRLPLGVLYEGDITRLKATAGAGSFGMLPNHIDYLSDLVPSVLAVTDVQGDELYFGIDEGMLVKRSAQVSIVTRRGIKGDSLELLHKQVTDSFLELTDAERVARSALSRLEADMVRRFSKLQRGAY